MKKNKIRKLDELSGAIPIDQFIIEFLNYGNYIQCGKLTHRDLKRFNSPYIEALPFEFVVANKELLASGRIVLVADCRNNIAPYLNPKEFENMDRVEIVRSEIKQIGKQTTMQENIDAIIRYQILVSDLLAIEKSFALLNKIRQFQKWKEINNEKSEGKRKVKQIES